MNLSYRVVVAHLLRNAVSPAVLAQAENLIAEAFQDLGFSGEVTLDQISKVRKTLARKLHPDVSGLDPAILAAVNLVLDKKKIRPQAKKLAQEAIEGSSGLTPSEVRLKVWNEHFAISSNPKDDSYGVIEPNKLSADKREAWIIIDALLTKHFGDEVKQQPAQASPPSSAPSGKWYHDINDPKYGPSSGTKSAPGGAEVSYSFTSQYKQAKDIVESVMKIFNTTRSNDLNSTQNLLNKLNQAEKEVSSILESVDKNTDLYARIQELLSNLRSNKQVVMDRIFPRV